MDSLKYGYARSSGTESEGRNIGPQVAWLEDAGIRPELIFTDLQSGGDFSRPGWQGLAERLREGDVVVVCYLDRLARSVFQGLSVIEDLRRRGVAIKSLDEGIDTSDDSPFAGQEEYLCERHVAHQQPLRSLAGGRRVSRETVRLAVERVRARLEKAVLGGIRQAATRIGLAGGGAPEWTPHLLPHPAA